MRPMPPPALKAAAAQAQQPLANLLQSYVPQTAPGVANTSNQHMMAMAKRANNTATRSSVLHDYLATV